MIFYLPMDPYQYLLKANKTNAITLYYCMVVGKVKLLYILFIITLKFYEMI